MIDPSGYDVWYDIAAETYRPSAMNLVVTLVLVVAFSRVAVAKRSGVWSVLGPIGAVFALVLCAWDIWHGNQEHQFLQHSLSRGSFTIVEGPVEDFRRGRSDCREVSFAVQDRDFNFLSCEIVSGFNGAGMRDLSGDCVKIALVRVPALHADRVAWFGVRRCP
jgi:hypothetical protein